MIGAADPARAAGPVRAAALAPTVEGAEGAARGSVAGGKARSRRKV